MLQLFPRELVERYGRHIGSTDGGTCYPEAHRVLWLEHRLHSSYEKSLMERTDQYLKDRVEEFDDYYHCMNPSGCELAHVSNSLNPYVDIYYAGKRWMAFEQPVMLLGGKA